MQMPSGLAPLPALLSKKQEWDRGCVSPLDPVGVGRCFFVPVMPCGEVPSGWGRHSILWCFFLKFL